MIDKSTCSLVDIHSHILPGLDDGPAHITECFETAARYLEIGIDCVIATPHHIRGSRWAADPETIVEMVRHTEQALADAAIPLRLLAGMEIALSDVLCHPFFADQFLSLGNQGYYLIEFPIHSAAFSMTESAVRRLLSSHDRRFIIAHPERCAFFHRNQQLLELLVAEGLLVQMNIGSILGHYGKQARDIACAFLQAGLVHFLATDCHAGSGRLPPCPEEFSLLADLLGSQTVRAAMGDNPRRMLEGQLVQPLTISTPMVFGNEGVSSAGKLGRKVMRFFR